MFLPKNMIRRVMMRMIMRLPPGRLMNDDGDGDDGCHVPGRLITQNAVQKKRMAWQT